MNTRAGFATALRSIRKKRNLTQEDFSDISSRTYLSSLERGIKSPTLEKIDQLACALDVHPITLLLFAYSSSEQCDLEDLYARIKLDLKSLR